jgi:protein involved in polysaccharide export with SLBB domain
MKNTSYTLSGVRQTLSAALMCCTLGLAMLAGPISTATAQEKPAGAATEQDYIVGVDDVLIITSPGHDAISQNALVLSDGTIRVNGVPDKIKAAGLTLEQIRAEVFKGLDRLYNNLELSVTLKEINSRFATIVGSRAPGRYPLRKDMRISQLIAVGGGVTAKTKLLVGTLIRDNKTTKLNMQKILGMEPDVDADLPLQVGDLVVIDFKEDPPPPMFAVVGAVAKSGSVIMPLDGTQVSIAKAIADVGGRTERAALSKVKLMRKGETLSLNLYPLLVEGKADVAEGKMFMEDGDVIIIPELDAKYLVMGQVNKPSAVYIPETRVITVQQALAEGGGPTQNADLKKAGIMRVVDGKKQWIKVNLQDTLTKPEKSLDQIMQDGDVLYIPPKGKGFSIQDLTSPLWVLSTFGLRLF